VHAVVVARVVAVVAEQVVEAGDNRSHLRAFKHAFVERITFLA
jgi:hypothetical protein